MLEILALVFLTRRVGEIVEEKGRKTIGYKLLTIALWIGGEVVFGIAGAVLVAMMDMPNVVVYLFALAGAVIGAGIAFTIAKVLPPLAIEQPPMPPTFR